ncbi:hypothetical protein PENTCL1PPCAC_16144, partial [Pristionchus entomophagus]
MEQFLISLDGIVLFAESYLLVRLTLARDPFFHIPCFPFFIVTGVGGILSVVGYQIHLRFKITEEFAWVFKLGYVLNSFGITLATLGKFCIVVNRFVVLRNGRLQENLWTRRVTVSLMTLIIILATIRCVPYAFCSYAFIVVNNVLLVTFFDERCMVTEKPLTSTIYFMYAIANVVLTALSLK